MKKDAIVLAALLFLPWTLCRGQITGGTCSYDTDFNQLRTEMVQLSLYGASTVNQSNLNQLHDNAKNVACNANQSLIAQQKTVLAFFCKLSFLFDLPQTSAADKDRLGRMLDLARRIIGQLFFNNPLPLLNIPAIPRPVPGPAGGCTVKIYIVINDAVGKAGREWHIGPNGVLNLTAKGDPPGGGYSWKAEPIVAGGIGFSTVPGSPDKASVFSQSKTGAFRVTVTYTDPGGNKCEDTLSIVVR